MAEDASISDASTLQYNGLGSSSGGSSSTSPSPQPQKAIQLNPEDYISLLRSLQTIAFPNGEPRKTASIRSPVRQHSPTFNSQHQHHHHYHPTVPSHHNKNNNKNIEKEEKDDEKDGNSTDLEQFLDAVARLLVQEPKQTVAVGMSLVKGTASSTTTARGKLSAELCVSQTGGDPRSVRGQAKKLWRLMQDVAHAASCEPAPRRTNSNRTTASTSSTGSVWSAKTAADYYLLEAVTTYSIPKIMSEIEVNWCSLRSLKKLLRKKSKTSVRRRKNDGRRTGGGGRNGADVFHDDSMQGVVNGVSTDEKLFDMVRTLCKGLKECRALYKQLQKKASDFSPALFVKADADEVMDSLCRQLLSAFSNFERGIGELDANLSFRMFDGNGVEKSRTLNKLDNLSELFGFSITDYVMDIFTYWADFQILDICATYQRGRLIRRIDFDVCVANAPTTSYSARKPIRDAVLLQQRSLDIDTIQELLEDSNVAHANIEKITEKIAMHEHRNRRGILSSNKSSKNPSPSARVHDVPDVLSNLSSAAYPYIGLSNSSNNLCVCCRLFLDSFNRSNISYGLRDFSIHELDPESDVSTTLTADWSFPAFVEASTAQRVSMEVLQALRHKIQFYVFLVLQRERSMQKPPTVRASTSAGKRMSTETPRLSMSIPPQARTRNEASSSPTTADAKMKRKSVDLGIQRSKSVTSTGSKGRFSWMSRFSGSSR